jgi:hypothetical protein
MNEDDPDHRFQFCEWFLHMYDGNISFSHLIVRSDEAAFKFYGIANRRNGVYWSHENPHITKKKPLVYKGYQCGAVCLSEE